MTDNNKKFWANHLRQEGRWAMIDLLHHYGADIVDEGTDGFWIYRIRNLRGHWVEELFCQDKNINDVFEISISLSRDNIVDIYLWPKIDEMFDFRKIISIEYSYKELANYIEKTESIFEEPFQFLGNL